MRYLKTYEESKDKSLITYLDLSSRNLTELSDLSEYTNLKELYCHYNKLTSLPKLPKTLKKLYCGENELTSLPELPDMLIGLYCFRNNLTSLPELPYTLTELNCRNNILTSLPELPISLKKLECNNNKLTSLPELPDTLEILYCRNNKLPFENLGEYLDWYQENEKMIDEQGLEYAYELNKNINDYNL